MENYDFIPRYTDIFLACSLKAPIYFKGIFLFNVNDLPFYFLLSTQEAFYLLCPHKKLIMLRV